MQTEERSLLVAPGDLVINPMWLTGGSIAVSSLPGAVSPDYRVFAPAERIHPRYIHHLLRSQPYIDQYKLFVRANTTFDRRVQQDDIDAMPLALPTWQEQRRIAEFLDDQVARIDRLVGARREQMVAVTHLREARLQQLQDDLTALYGETRLSHVIVGLEQGWSPQADSIPALSTEWGVMRSGCVNGGVFRSEDNKRLPADLPPRAEYEIQEGDLLMSRASGSLDLIGSVAVVPAGVRSRLLLCDKIYRITPAKGWSAEFVAHMLRTRRSREEIRLGVSGAEGMANNLPSGVIRDLRVPMASPGQQSTALERADRHVQAEAAVLAGLLRSIELLTEYKSSLISGAVTGGIHVSDAGSGVPE